MNARERYLTTMNFEKPDRMMRWEFGYFHAAIERWYSEGLPRKHGFPTHHVKGEPLGGPAGYWGWGPIWSPRDQDVAEYMEFDHPYVNIPLENWIWPKFEEIILDEDEDTITYIDSEGRKTKKMKDGTTTTWLSWLINDRDAWEKVKDERFQLRIKDRLPADWEEQAKLFQERTYPLSLGGAYVGCFGSIRELMGDANHLMAYYDNPELIHDILSHLTDLWLTLFEEVLKKVKPDTIEIFEDMAYRNGPLISPTMVKKFMVPYYKKITGFAKDHGIKHIIVDCDGNFTSLIPTFLEAGITALYPCEVQAGINVVELRKSFPQLRLLGGINKLVLSQGRKAIDRELESKLPFMLETGGYIPYIDHLVPPDVSWEDFQYYRQKMDTLADQVYSRSK